MKFTMDPIYVQQPTAMWSGQGTIPMDYSTYPHPPFSSPPATPMTPVTPHPAVFTVQQYELLPAAPYHHNPPPPSLPPPPDYRLFALCQYLQNYNQISESDLKLWWDDFMTEFFHENATLAIEVDLGDGMRKFCLTRQWICLYFKSMMEGGITGINIRLTECVHTFHQSMQQIDCRMVTIETDHSTPQPTKVCVSGPLILDFSLEDKPRIISWYFQIKEHTEFIPRSTVTTTEGDQTLTANITCNGILPATQKLLVSAGMVESGLQDVVHVTTTSDIPSSQWQEPLPLQPNVDGTLHSISPTTQPTPLPLPPPLFTHSTHNCTFHQVQPQTTVTGSGASKSRVTRSSSVKRSKSSPTSKKNQFVLIAAEAVPLTSAASDELLMFQGLDERTITRVDNQTKSKTSSPHSTFSPCTTTSIGGSKDNFMSPLPAPWPSDGLSLMDQDRVAKR